MKIDDIPVAVDLVLAVYDAPRPSARTVHVLRSLTRDGQVTRLLWHRTGDTQPETTAWLEAVDQLGRLEPTPALVDGKSLRTVLSWIGMPWRAVAPGIVGAMATACAAAATPEAKELVHAEVRHVARWFLTVAPAVTPAPAFRDLVERALAWEPDDEILMRQRPARWDDACPQVHFAGFDLQPLLSTADLVNAAHHRGALCNLRVQDACAQGIEAWWLCLPEGESGVEGKCVVGLGRTVAGDDWAVVSALAPPHLQDAVLGVAESIASQANTRWRLRELGQIINTPSTLLADVKAQVDQLVQTCSTSTTSPQGTGTGECNVAGGVGIWDNTVGNMCGVAHIAVAADFNEHLRNGTPVILDTSVFLEPAAADTLGRLGTAGAPRARQLVVHEAVFLELEAKSRRAEHRLQAAAAFRLLERWQLDGRMDFVNLVSDGDARVYADPHLVRLCVKLAEAGPVVLLSRDRALRIRARGCAPAVVALDPMEVGSVAAPD